MKKLLTLLIFTALFSNAETNDTSVATRAQNKNKVNTICKSWKTEYKNNPDIMILPGLKADRKTKEINILAEATGLEPGETAEYFLIGENSGHDYEAVAISFALPSDIRKALIFLGMTPGRPVNYKEMQFWPKGERIKMYFRNMSIPDTKTIPAEQLVKNTKTGKTIPESGFVFTGSLEVTSATNSELKALAADVFDPMSVAANYNEADSILDLPRLAKQDDVYESQVIDDSCLFKPGELLDIIIAQEYTNGKTRVQDFNLKIKWQPSESTNTENHLFFDLSSNKKTVLTNAPLAILLDNFKKTIKAGHDPFVQIDFADNIPLHSAKKICSILSVLDTENGIHIEPPRKGQIYYKSFIPENYLRDRINRSPIKWELHIKSVDGKVKYSLTNIDPVWKDNETTPTIHITDYEIENSNELIKLLKSKEITIPVILVFAQPDITYRQLMDIIIPVTPIYDVVHVFEEYPNSDTIGK